MFESIRRLWLYPTVFRHHKVKKSLELDQELTKLDQDLELGL